MLSDFIRFRANKPDSFVFGLQIKCEWGVGDEYAFKQKEQIYCFILEVSESINLLFYYVDVSSHYLHEWVFPILMHSICM